MTRKEATVCERGQSSGDGEEERNGGIIRMPKPTGLINKALWTCTGGQGKGEMTWTIPG